MRWSAEVWEKTLPIYQSILEMPFILELQDGTLSNDRFRFYLEQDSVYLSHFGRALSLIGARAADDGDALAFMQFAAGAIVVENALHETYFREWKIVPTSKAAPVCHHYVHFLKSTAALDPVETGMAALLPCFLIYRETGKHIYAHQTAGDNPYKKWIDTYAGDEFDQLVVRAIDICDRAAERCTPAQREKMTEAYEIACRMEHAFWEAAYRFRRWDLGSV